MAGVKSFDTKIGDFGANAELITPSDTIIFDGPVSIVCYDGTVVAITTSGGSQLLHPVVAGVPIPVRVTRVRATGTDATKIVAYW
ncbi:hypothetical protein [Xanthomonas phage JGB6]|nr:hypothetical protein [Xanthomonas phage JGB6]